MYHPHDTHTGSCPTLQEHVSINTATVLMRLLGNGTRYPVHDVQLPSSAEGFLELCDHVATTWERSERRSLLFSVAAEEVVDDVLPTRWFWTTVFLRGVGVTYIKVVRLLRIRSSAVLVFAQSTFPERIRHDVQHTHNCLHQFFLHLITKHYTQTLCLATYCHYTEWI